MAAVTTPSTFIRRPALTTYQVQDNSVWASMDFEGHAYTVSIWCQVNPQKYAVVLMTAAGPNYKDADAAVTAIGDTW